MPADGRTDGRRKAWLSMIHRLCGMPDYAAYLEHLRQHHPESPVPTEREFFTQFTEARYGAGASRCC